MTWKSRRESDDFSRSSRFLYCLRARKKSSVQLTRNEMPTSGTSVAKRHSLIFDRFAASSAALASDEVLGRAVELDVCFALDVDLDSELVAGVESIICEELLAYDAVSEKN